MVNRYNYTSDIIKEYQNAWWRNEYKIGNVSMFVTFIIAIIMLILKISNQNINIFSIFLVLIPILYFIMYPIRKNKATKAEMLNYKKLYKNQNNKIEIKLDEKIIIESNGSKTEVEYNKIKKIIETKNLIVIILKENMTISLKKDSFIDATPEECIKYLKEKKKSKNNIKKNKEE